MAYYPLTRLNVTTEVRYDSIKTTSVKEKITGLDTHIYKIQGYPEKDKKLTKTLDLCGKNGDTFMVNAWGRGDALPESTDENRRFGVEVVFVGKDKDGKEITDVHYTNFSPDILDWQFLSDVYVAKIEYTSVKVSYTYCRNANLAFFDGLSLFKEGFGQTFTYDKDNNIIAVTDLQNQKQKFEYNDNLDMTGKRVVYYKYDSWGRAVNISGTMAATVGQKNPFRYRGYYFDAESGMYYLQSRYYDPEIRRFISADNIIVTGTSVEYQNVNLYEYCSDNPINFQDPSGHFILSALAGAGAYFFEAIVSLGARYLLTKEIAGVVDEFAWYRKSQKEKRDEALLSRVITRDLLKQDYDYWTAELKKINGKKQVVGGEPLTVEEACLRVSQLKSVMCRNKSAAWHIIIVNRYFNAVKPERHGDEAYSHFHPIRNPTGYPSVHIWFFD